MPNAYSFCDVQCAIAGPGGNIIVSEGGVADEGITISMTEDKSSMVTGADGSGMHSLHCSRAGRVTIRLLKNSPVNALLMRMYHFQVTSSAYLGRNVLSLTNPVWGDEFMCRDGAFTKLPDNVNGKEGGMMEWVLNFIMIDEQLGDGTLSF